MKSLIFIFILISSSLSLSSNETYVSMGNHGKHNHDNYSSLAAIEVPKAICSLITAQVKSLYCKSLTENTLVIHSSTSKRNVLLKYTFNKDNFNSLLNNEKCDGKNRVIVRDRVLLNHLGITENTEEMCKSEDGLYVSTTILEANRSIENIKFLTDSSALDRLSVIRDFPLDPNLALTKGICELANYRLNSTSCIGGSYGFVVFLNYSGEMYKYNYDVSNYNINPIDSPDLPEEYNRKITISDDVLLSMLNYRMKPKVVYVAETGIDPHPYKIASLKDGRIGNAGDAWPMHFYDGLENAVEVLKLAPPLKSREQMDLSNF